MSHLAAGLCLVLAATPAMAAGSLAGTWFGQGEPFDKTEMYLDHFLPNGEIHSQFRLCLKGQVRDSTEDGTRFRQHPDHKSHAP